MTLANHQKGSEDHGAREKKEDDRKEKWIFGYGDAGLLIILFAYLAECFGVNANTNREVDFYVFLKGAPPLVASFVLAIKGRRSPGALGVFIIGGAYLLVVLYMAFIRMAH